MFWNKVAGIYDFIVDRKLGAINQAICLELENRIKQEDEVLECACGTGILSVAIAKKCKRLLATDYAEGMLKRARKKCEKFSNVKVETADITKLPYHNGEFDKVVAGNVIHLLKNPAQGVRELDRVCKKGGFLIIPTYIHEGENKKTSWYLKFLKKGGVQFQTKFSFSSYQDFFKDMGYSNVEFIRIPGKISSVIAIIQV